MVVNYSTLNIKDVNYPNFKRKKIEESNVVAKTTENVDKFINETFDTFIGEDKNVDEETKKSHKTTIKVVSAVLVATGFAALFNPKFMNRISKKLSNISKNAKIEADKYKYNSIKNKWYLFKSQATDVIKKSGDFYNNLNPVKDLLFKNLCGFTSLSRKAHNGITKWFDKMAKNTVKRTYKNASNDLNALERYLNTYRNKLSVSEQVLFDSKLNKIKESRKYFDVDKVVDRLSTQEKLMSNLQDDVTEKALNFGKGILGKGADRKNLLKNNFAYWPEEIIKEKKNNVVEEGNNAVAKLFGDKKGQKGLYTELTDIIAPHLDIAAKEDLEKVVLKSSKALENANYVECSKYFDKKRDLLLGGAPTDILSNLFFLTLGGVAVGKADTNEERLSKAATRVVPTLAGVGTSLVMTSMLISGTAGLATSLAASVIVNRIGSLIDKHLIRKNNAQEINVDNSKTQENIAEEA